MYMEGSSKGLWDPHEKYKGKFERETVDYPKQTLKANVCDKFSFVGSNTLNPRGSHMKNGDL